MLNEQNKEDAVGRNLEPETEARICQRRYCEGELLYPRCDPVFHFGLVQQCTGVINYVHVHFPDPERDCHEAGRSLVKAAPLGRAWRPNFRARTGIEILN